MRRGGSDNRQQVLFADYPGDASVFEKITGVGGFVIDIERYHYRSGFNDTQPGECVEDLAEAIKADVSALSTSGANFGGLNHLSWISLVQGLGGEASAVNWVPTDGGAPSLQLLVSGAIDVVVAQFPEAKALIEENSK